MISLIRIEWMKIFGRKSSWIYIIFLVLALLLGAFLNNHFIEDSNTWRYMNSVVYNLSMLVTLFTVIVGSGNVAAEFSDGTIKQLLIRPHSRVKILLAKYIVVLSYSLLLLGTLILSGYVFGLMFFGPSGYNTPVFEPNFLGEVKEGIAGEQFFIKMLYSIPSLLIIVTLSFMLSTLFKSNALAVGVAVFVLFFSSTLGGLIMFFSSEYEWLKILIFPHLDLTVYALQDEVMEGITLPISLAILAVYYVIFVAITFITFKMRDISI
mgnify:FL=1